MSRTVGTVRVSCALPRALPVLWLFLLSNNNNETVMDPTEQMMMQVWLGGLLGRLKEGKVQECIAELELALTQIGEDRAGASDKPSTPT
jgi:hypothetical protein